MQLVLLALGLLLTRAQAYLTGPLAARLTEGAQQLAALAQQQQGVNVAEVRRAGGQRLVGTVGLPSRYTSILAYICGWCSCILACAPPHTLPHIPTLTHTHSVVFFCMRRPPRPSHV